MEVFFIMAVIYAKLIMLGEEYKKFEQVPVHLQPAVRQYLLDRGLGIDGKPLPVEEPETEPEPE